MQTPWKRINYSLDHSYNPLNMYGQKYDHRLDPGCWETGITSVKHQRR